MAPRPRRDAAAWSARVPELAVDVSATFDPRAGVDGDAATPNQVKKKKLWPPVADGLKMVGGVATFGGDVISTSEGPCTCATIADGDIS